MGDITGEVDMQGDLPPGYVMQQLTERPLLELFNQVDLTKTGIVDGMATFAGPVPVHRVCLGCPPRLALRAAATRVALCGLLCTFPFAFLFDRSRLSLCSCEAGF